LANAHGVDSAYCEADLRRVEDVGVLTRFAEDKFGRIDILVNNAGVQHVCPVARFPDERWDEVLSLNLSAAFRTTKTVLGGMRARGLGTDHQRRFGARPRRERAQIGLCRGKARARRPDKGRRDRDGE
jgi:NAD(P)-dependent dehydrogenase (short-subunit alcohol dehydrogenase family)